MSLSWRRLRPLPSTLSTYAVTPIRRPPTVGPFIFHFSLVALPPGFWFLTPVSYIPSNALPR